MTDEELRLLARKLRFLKPLTWDEAHALADHIEPKGVGRPATRAGRERRLELAMLAEDVYDGYIEDPWGERLQKEAPSEYQKLLAGRGSRERSDLYVGELLNVERRTIEGYRKQRRDLPGSIFNADTHRSPTAWAELGEAALARFRREKDV